MITLLERDASFAYEHCASKEWSRRSGLPAIVRDGTPYDPHLDRFFADLPLTACLPA
jgi:hypothetical protein